MEREAALQIIRNCFSHVVVERIVVEYEPLVEEDVAKVIVPDDQLDEALRGNGADARRAAMQSGLAVEVLSTSEYAAMG